MTQPDVPATKDAPMTPQQTRAFVAAHFDDLINRGDIGVIERNVRKDYVDHDGPGGRRTNLDQSRGRTSATLQRLKDLRVEVRDVLADGDKVVVRNVWTASDPETGGRVQMHGFVLFRLEGNQLAERWATVTEPVPLEADVFEW